MISFKQIDAVVCIREFDDLHLKHQVSDCGYDARKEAEEFIREQKDKKCLEVRFIDDVIGE